MVDVVECRFKIEIEAPEPRGAPAGRGLENRLDRVVAAPARPEAIRPGFEACLPLGLQRVTHPVLLGAAGDGGYPQRPEFLVALRDVHPPDWQGLPRCGRPLEAAGQFRAVPGGQRDLPVHPGCHAASVLLGHAPHADQRVGARAQHQPLKAGDLACVPGLLRREDPSPKTRYVPLGFPPVDGIPAERGVVGLVHHDRPGHPVLFTVPSVSFRSHVPQPLIVRRLTVLTSAPLRAGSPGPVSGSRSSRAPPVVATRAAPPLEEAVSVPSSRCLPTRRSPQTTAAPPPGRSGLRFLSTPVPAGGLALPYGRVTAGGKPADPRRDCDVPRH